MKTVLIILSLSLATLFFSLYFQLKQLRKVQIKVPISWIKMLLKNNWLNTFIERSSISPELFLILHLAAAFLTGVLFIKTVSVGENVTIQLLIPVYILLAPTYALMAIKNSKVKEAAVNDTESIQRLTHMLERSGTDDREINLYVAHITKGPLKPYMLKIASAQKLRIDICEVYTAMKNDFKDLKEVVSLANIAIQKQSTGKSDELYSKQLEDLKAVKHKKYRMRRFWKRIQNIVIAILLFITFLFMTIAPLVMETINGLTNIMFN